MLGLLAAGLSALVCSATVAPVGVGNALTLPAQRHLVRIDPGDGAAIWLLALQQDGTNGHGLAFFRSDDEAQSFSYMAPIQPDWSERDEADLIAVGNDIALVYSYEGPALDGSTRHDVYFQWWRYRASSRTFEPDTPVRVFDSTSSNTAYSRAELARDSTGRIWVQAFRLEPDGSSSAAIAESDDDGDTFNPLADLDHISNRGGGRLLWLGNEVVFVYAMHDGFQGTHFRIHHDWDAPSQWQPVTLAFSDGMYHGAALSAVADGAGGMHLFYKNENDEDLYYRHFDGSTFGPATRLDDSNDWALQPAVTLIGDEVYVFYNHMFSATDYDFRYRVLRDGSFTSPQVIASRGDWKGYPAAAETLPAWFDGVPALFGETPDANSSGVLTEVVAPHTPSEPSDGGSGNPPDAGPPDGGAPDAGAPDAGSTGGGGTETGTLFSDTFTRNGGDGQALGASWSVQGLWFTNGRAVTDLDGTDLAVETVASCRDCQVSASVTGFGVPETAIFLRASVDGRTRYQLDLISSGHVRIQRISGGATTVLADVASGIGDLSSPAVLTLSATGGIPVQLTAKVNGRAVASATDSSSAAIGSAGYAGLFSRNAGVWFDDFSLVGLGSGTTGTTGGSSAGSTSGTTGSSSTASSISTTSGSSSSSTSGASTGSSSSSTGSTIGSTTGSVTSGSVTSGAGTTSGATTGSTSGTSTGSSTGTSGGATSGTTGNSPEVIAVAVFDGSDGQGTAPDTEYFDGTNSHTTDANHWIAAIHWTFGDGTSSNADWTSHKFTAPGDYTVTMTATDDLGRSSRATLLVHVTGTSTSTTTGAASSTAGSTSGSTSASSTTTGSTSATSSTTGSTSATSSTTGSTSGSTSASSSSSGSTSGISSTTGSTSSTTAGATAGSSTGSTTTSGSSTGTTGNSPYVVAIAVFDGSDGQGAAPDTEYFDGTNSHTTDPNHWIAAIHWAFGDGTSSNLDWTSHKFTAPGDYTVTMTATDDAGRSSKATLLVHVTGTSGAATTGGSSATSTSGTTTGTTGSTTGTSGSSTSGSSGALSLTVEYTDTSHRILAVGSGTAYAADLSSGDTLFASTDGRTWSARGGDHGAFFFQMTALADGTLLADVIHDGAHYLARSQDGGSSWSDVLNLGSYRSLTSHNWAELDGEVFFLEYQDFTTGNTTLRLWASGDDGQTWAVRNTFSTHRHGHGLAADPAHHALWAFFGDTDAQCGVYRSTDGGQSFTLLLSGQPGDVVDAAVRSDGSLLFGQDISYLPPTPHIATLGPTGVYSELAAISGPSYAIHALSGGGYVVGSEREPDGDIYPAGEVSAHLYLSADGKNWTRALNYPRLSSSENARADVYWELPSGELLVELENIQGFGPGGKGYQLVLVNR